METIFSTELIQALGVGAIPIVIVAGVVYYLFQLLKERDKVMRDVVNTFNKTIQEHLNSNSQMIKQMISSFAFIYAKYVKQPEIILYLWYIKKKSNETSYHQYSWKFLQVYGTSSSPCRNSSGIAWGFLSSPWFNCMLFSDKTRERGKIKWSW